MTERDPAVSATDGTEAAELHGRRLLAADDITWALWAVLRTADKAEHAMAQGLGMPHTDAVALEHILTSPDPLGPSDIARRLGVTTASATVLVDRLVARGQVERRPDHRDGRRRVLTATDRARREVVEALTPVLQALDEVAARMDDSARTVVLDYLRRVAEIQQGIGTQRRT